MASLTVVVHVWVVSNESDHENACFVQTQVVGCLIRVNGSLLFSRNNGTLSSGAAVYILAFGQVEIMKGARVIFANNTGR